MTVPHTVTGFLEGRVNGFWRGVELSMGEAIVDVVSDGARETRHRATAVARATTAEVRDCRMFGRWKEGGGLCESVNAMEGVKKKKSRTYSPPLYFLEEQVDKQTKKYNPPTCT